MAGDASARVLVTEKEKKREREQKISKKKKPDHLNKSPFLSLRLEFVYPLECAAQAEAEEHSHQLYEDDPAGRRQQILQVGLHELDHGRGATLSSTVHPRISILQGVPERRTEILLVLHH